MNNRRAEPRMLCADLVDIQWREKNGRVRRAVANLEDISMSGACVQVDAPIPLQTALRICYPKGELQGRVCYCVYREIGYFVGLQFDAGFKWSSQSFRPQHMLDPRRLVMRALRRSSRESTTTDIVQ